MKKVFIALLFAVVAMATTTETFAQVEDTLWVYNTDAGKEMNVVFEVDYTWSEVDSLIMTSRTAFIDDAEEMIRYYFQDQGIKNVFWQKAIQRYIEWPEQAERADNLGEYYHPKCMIYVPNDDYVNAIVFDWSSGEIKIAIFCEDGLWTTTEYLSDRWAIFIDSTFAKMIDFSNMEDEH